jgi:hypothetical protein
MSDKAWERLIALAGIGLMLCLAVVPLFFGDVAAAVPMICLTIAFGLVVLCRVIFEGMRDQRRRRSPR